MPDGSVVHLEARLLREMINREIHSVRCAKNCRWKGQKALRLGDLCAGCGHPWWAMKVWNLGRWLIEDQDYDEWRYVWFNPRYVRLSDVVSEDLCLELGRRIDNLWRSMGHPEMARYEQSACMAYEWLWLEKYDYSRQEIDDECNAMLSELSSQQATELLFRDGGGYTQEDFFAYFGEEQEPEEFY
jgi:hypothetical protein